MHKIYLDYHCRGGVKYYLNFEQINMSMINMRTKVSDLVVDSDWEEINADAQITRSGKQNYH